MQLQPHLCSSCTFCWNCMNDDGSKCVPPFEGRLGLHYIKVPCQFNFESLGRAPPRRLSQRKREVNGILLWHSFFGRATTLRCHSYTVTMQRFKLVSAWPDKSWISYFVSQLIRKRLNTIDTCLGHVSLKVAPAKVCCPFLRGSQLLSPALMNSLRVAIYSSSFMKSKRKLLWSTLLWKC